MLRLATNSQQPSDRVQSRENMAANPIIRVGLIGGQSFEDDFFTQPSSTEKVCCCRPINVNDVLSNEDLNDYDVMVVRDPGSTSDGPDESSQGIFHQQLDLLRDCRLGVLVLTSRPWVFTAENAGVVYLPPDSSLDRIQGALTALAHLRPVIRRVDQQLVALQHLSQNLKKRYASTNRELLMASRLQRDFLPKETTLAGPLLFSTLFRPCSWVSGDIFDVFRLDEQHWGFYLADAVGHGVAAGLLTMYIKHAIRTKRILRDGYELKRPSEVLKHLNDQLIDQQLPNSQFITGWYGLINIATLELHYSVAGHPPALLIDKENEISELRGEGCLMGVDADAVYHDEAIQLHPGQRVMVYSDGLEPTLITSRPEQVGVPLFESGIPELLRLPSDEMIDTLRQRLDNTPGSLTPIDDMSIMMMDVQSGANTLA